VVVLDPQIRRQAEDFAHWRQLGNVGWSFEDVLPYFKCSEGRIGGVGRADDDLRGHDRPLAVSDLGDRNALSEAYIQAAQALGIPRNDDFSGRVQEGVGYFQVTARRGRRCSAAVAFLRPARRITGARPSAGAGCLTSP
jgi:choline dehydrogenase